MVQQARRIYVTDNSIVERTGENMTEIERIQDQLKRSFFGPSWHGPCVTEALEGASAELSSAASVKRRAFNP